MDKLLSKEVEIVQGRPGEIDQALVRVKYRSITLYLIEKGITISSMESCTGGQIASLLTDTEGSSAVFKGALVTYRNDVKIKSGVPQSVIEEFGVYSSETAAAMADACRKSFDSDLGLGVTGSFGNADPHNIDSVPGEVYFAIANDEGTKCFKCTIPAQDSRLSYKLYMADVIAESLAAVLQINQIFEKLNLIIKKY